MTSNMDCECTAVVCAAATSSLDGLPALQCVSLAALTAESAASNLCKMPLRAAGVQGTTAGVERVVLFQIMRGSGNKHRLCPMLHTNN
jgi:hypothetical protein